VTGTQDEPEIRTMVRVAFLLRLALLLVSLLGFVGQSLTVLAASAIVLLALTSMAGLSWEPAATLMERHPLVVLVDSVVMTVLMIALGTDNPLVLVALSSCVVAGVVLAPAPAALATVVIVSGYLLASLSDGLAESSFVSGYGLPITFVCVVLLGQAFRVVVDRKRRSERAFADMVTGTAAAEERARLARELHDSTAKTLQGLTLTAQSLEHWIPRDPDRAAEEAAEIAAAADDAMVRLRQLFSALRADDLDQPFHDSLAALASEAVRGSGTRVVLQLEPVPVSAPGVRYELLAAAREAVLNAVAHSGADRVTVTMTARGEEVHLEVRDDGCGFALDRLHERERDGHFGVRGYAERLASIGGVSDVETSPGAGTRVRFTAPVMGLRELEHGR